MSPLFSPQYVTSCDGESCGRLARFEDYNPKAESDEREAKGGDEATMAA